MQVRSLSWEDPLEKEMATDPSIFAWKTPWTVEPGQAPVHGVTKSQTRLSVQAHTHTCRKGVRGRQGLEEEGLRRDRSWVQGLLGCWKVLELEVVAACKCAQCCWTVPLKVACSVPCVFLSLSARPPVLLPATTSVSASTQRSRHSWASLAW